MAGLRTRRPTWKQNILQLLLHEEAQHMLQNQLLCAGNVQSQILGKPGDMRKMDSQDP